MHTSQISSVPSVIRFRARSATPETRRRRECRHRTCPKGRRPAPHEGAVRVSKMLVRKISTIRTLFKMVTVIPTSSAVLPAVGAIRIKFIEEWQWGQPARRLAPPRCPFSPSRGGDPREIGASGVERLPWRRTSQPSETPPTRPPMG